MKLKFKRSSLSLRGGPKGRRSNPTREIASPKLRRRPRSDNARGFVSLVGAGPGDPKLLTIRGREALETCDVVIYDYLVNPMLLDDVPSTECIQVQQEAGSATRQQLIEQKMAALAQSGKHVVRLKGGDPFVFGRGGEEMLFLAKNKIPFEVIPGVTSGIAAPAYAGIPLTHRELASDVTFLTAHENPLKKSAHVNWKAIAALNGTIVLYMGVKTLSSTVKLLLRHGKSEHIPISVVHWGTTDSQKVVSGTLATIVSRVERAGLTAPSIAVIGSVNELRKELAWFEERPLFGKTVLVTRAEKQISKLETSLSREGAHVVSLPTIEITPIRNFKRLDQTIHALSQFNWIVFTSENGVEMFFSRLKLLKQDARALYGIRVAAIGPGTEARLAQYGIVPELVPATYTTEGLLRAFKKKKLRGDRFLLLRADIAPKRLKIELEKVGAVVRDVPVYQTRKPVGLAKRVRDVVTRESLDYVTFTSASTATHFYEVLSNGKRLHAKAISIGPMTSQAIRSLGGKVTREARQSSIPGLVRAIVDEVRCGVSKR